MTMYVGNTVAGSPGDKLRKENLLIWSFMDSLEALDESFDLQLPRQELACLCEELDRLYIFLEICRIDTEEIRLKAADILNSA